MKKKDTVTEFRTARLNPANEPERQALEIIKAYEAQGTSFKRLVVAAILKFEGIPMPEQRPQIDIDTLRADLEAQFQELSQQLLDTLKTNVAKTGKARFSQDEDEDDGESVSRFARNFANGYLQRKQQLLGDEDE